MACSVDLARIEVLALDGPLGRFWAHWRAFVAATGKLVDKVCFAGGSPFFLFNSFCWRDFELIRF